MLIFLDKMFGISIHVRFLETAHLPLPQPNILPLVREQYFLDPGKLLTYLSLNPIFARLSPHLS